MLDVRIKEYLSRIGIRKIFELDTALLEAYGPEEGRKHIERLTELYDRSEERLIYGSRDTPYLYRQEELVDYLNQSLQISLLAASFYDRVFFRRAMEYLLRYENFWKGDIIDIGCGNGILSCFLALCHPYSFVTGLDLSGNAVSVAEELAKKLQIGNVRFDRPKAPGKRKCGTLFTCRTVHENIVPRPLCEEAKGNMPSAGEQTRRYEAYAEELSAFVRPGGYLISIERYEGGPAGAGLAGALRQLGFCPVKETQMQFSCKNGDETASFQTGIFKNNSCIEK